MPIVICILCYHDCILMILYPPFVVPIVPKKKKEIESEMQECIDWLALHFPLCPPYSSPFFSSSHIIWAVRMLSFVYTKLRNWLWNAGMYWLACLHFFVCRNVSHCLFYHFPCILFPIPNLIFKVLAKRWSRKTLECIAWLVLPHPAVSSRSC